MQTQREPYRVYLLQPDGIYESVNGNPPVRISVPIEEPIPEPLFRQRVVGEKELKLLRPGNWESIKPLWDGTFLLLEPVNPRHVMRMKMSHVLPLPIRLPKATPR